MKKDQLKYIKELRPNLDFSKSIYSGYHSKISFRCPIHGDLERLFMSVVRVGCGLCKKLDRTKQRILEKHGDSLDFSNTVFVNGKGLMSATCLIHGKFSLRADQFMVRGCQKCGREKGRVNGRLKDVDILDRFNKVHGKLYIYDISSFDGTRSKIRIKCKTHGWFTQEMDVHLRGGGCRKCKTVGFSRGDFIRKANSLEHKKPKLYLIKCWNDSECFYKVGITLSSINKRFRGNFMPYNYKVLASFVSDPCTIYDTETSIHKFSNKFHYKPKIKFGGSARECFSKVYFKGRIYE